MGGTVVGRWQHGGGHVVRIGVVGIRITAGIHAVLWMLMFLLLRWTSSNGSGPSALLLLRSCLMKKSKSKREMESHEFVRKDEVNACVSRQHESWRDFKAKEAVRTLPLRSASPVDECSSALLVFPLLLLDRFVATSEAPG